MSTDIYDGRVLIDAINRTRLPAAQCPFAAGDEIVAIDGRPATGPRRRASSAAVSRSCRM
jgi:hypothetical protein